MLRSALRPDGRGHSTGRGPAPFDEELRAAMTGNKDRCRDRAEASIRRWLAGHNVPFVSANWS